MSKPNPTRPHASPADVEQRIAELTPVEQKRLKDYGYNINDLRRICEIEAQADAVDALLAIVTDRKGYEYDLRDMAEADKVAKTLGATISAQTHLIRRKKYVPPAGRFSMPRNARKPPKNVWETPLGGILICLGVIAVIAVLAVLFK
jgi:hypothetical protein